jgi:hypothetical protein
LTTGGGAAVEGAAWRAAGDVIVEDTNRKVEAP